MHPNYYSLFNRAARLAKGSLWQRLVANPLRYLYLQFFRRIVFPVRHRTREKSCPLFWGDTMKILLPGSADIWLLGCKTDDSEIRLTRYLLHTLKTGDHFLDAGAHGGYYSLLAAYLCGNNGKVVSVEASPETFSLLQCNTAHHPMIVPVNKGLADKEGILSFSVFPVPYDEFNTISPGQYTGAGWIKKIPPKQFTIPAVTGDQLLREQEAHPAVIKIDVEGAEAMVIAGLQEFLTSHHPVVIMEFVCSRRDAAPHRKADALLQQWQYRPHRITEEGRLEPVSGEVISRIDDSGLESDNIVYTRSYLKS